jgi:hypothetical protein
MIKPLYAPVQQRTKESILISLSGGNPLDIRNALVSAAYWEDDWRWAQEQLIKFADSPDALVLWAVATGFSFIAAFNGEIDQQKVSLVLQRLKKIEDTVVAAAAQEAEEDIEHFVVRRKAGSDIHLAERLPEAWRPPFGHFPE